MISFLLEEGVLTIGVLSGLFTTGLLNSLKTNVIDPGIEKIIPSHQLDSKSSPILPASPDSPDSPDNNFNKSKFSSLFPIPLGIPNPAGPKSNIIRWQTFLKDFITWLLMMFMIYLFWKFVLNPRKLNKTS